ncbi:hypothetical protein KHA96_14300 [Bacillus sp. FJAT-49711]|uniref:hypothetical protein n=1 Tax=Bacillus sp. FJAT-49711 TaxID=2833585 RepID=UPI001BCA4F56|nr:hypothetical protein [Bacillus sp. FJAT-49711]MBS4219484.1 hypothetical protein [Bacillus sp. FJAT-49711]
MRCVICEKEFQVALSVSAVHQYAKCCSQGCFDTLLEEKRLESAKKEEKIEWKMLLFTPVIMAFCILYYIYIPTSLTTEGHLLYDLIYKVMGVESNEGAVMIFDITVHPVTIGLLFIAGILVGSSWAKSKKIFINKVSTFLTMIFLVPVFIPAVTIIATIFVFKKIMKMARNK